MWLYIAIDLRIIEFIKLLKSVQFNNCYYFTGQILMNVTSKLMDVLMNVMTQREAISVVVMMAIDLILTTTHVMV